MYVHRALSCHCRQQKCGFQHSSSQVDCNFDARLLSKTRKERWTEKLSKHVCSLVLVKQLTVLTRQALVQTQPGPEKASALSVIILHLWGLYKLLQSLASVSVHKIPRFILPLLLLLCNCCHDPFIVRSAQTRPLFTGFTQLARIRLDVHDQR